MPLHLGFVSVPVADIDRAKTFFVNSLGFDVRYDEPMPQGGRWVMLAPPKAQTAIVLTDGSDGRPTAGPGGRIGHGFEVDDVFATHAQLASRDVEFMTLPTNEFFGGWAEFKDSEGNIWGLHSPVPATANV